MLDAVHALRKKSKPIKPSYDNYDAEWLLKKTLKSMKLSCVGMKRPESSQTAC